MFRLLVVLVLVAAPGVSFAQTAHTFNKPTTDIFISRADVCATNSTGCGTPTGVPQNVVQSGSGTLRAFVSFRVPVTQAYRIIFTAADLEGAVRGTREVQMSSPIDAGTTVSLWAPFTPDLLSGFYRLQVIILGENGIAAISQPFQFRYCNPACTPD